MPGSFDPITNKEQLAAFQTANEVSEQNKKLWLELWDRGCYVQPVGQLHVGEIDYLVVSCAAPKMEPQQRFMSFPN